ncbi:MAG: hypothetical protein AB1798_18990 [Spirochaetota bacterium]
MHLKIIFSIFLVSVLIPISCGPISDLRTIADLDYHPPVMNGIETEDAQKLVIRFNEKASIITGSINILPKISIESVTTNEESIILQFQETQTPGQEYILEAAVRDEKENSMNFMTKFYGFNPNIPQLCINEFITQGSGKHPDLVELYVLTPGNMAGICMYEGTPDTWDDKMVFPPFNVNKGDYILVHFKPQGIPEEINETEAKNKSGGYDASPEAFDFWLKNGTGLSGNNGVLSIYSNPHGKILDGVLYSNRTSASDDQYRGFGSKDVLAMAEELVEDKGWIIRGDLVAPEDAVNPTGSTATRSLCRSSRSDDSDSSQDWHIVPTSTSTFGSRNSDAVYTP